MRQRRRFAVALLAADVLCWCAFPPAVRTEERPDDAASSQTPAIVELSLADLGPADDVAWWMTYNYRNPRVEPLLPALQKLLGGGELSTGADAHARRQFFAALLRGERELVDRVGALKASRTAPEVEVLEDILARAAAPAAARPTSREGIAALWAEYRATGNSNAIRSILDLFFEPGEQADNQLLAEATASLLVNVPRHPEVLETISLRLQMAADPAKTSLERVRAALAVLSTRGNTLLTRASNLLANKSPLEAVPLIRESMKNFGIYQNYGKAAESLIMRGKRDEAIPFLLRYLDLAPRNEWALTKLGWLYNQREEWANAILWLEKAVAVNPNTSPQMYSLVVAYCQTGESAKARDLAVRYFEGDVTVNEAKALRKYLAKFSILIPPGSSDLALLQRKEYADLEKRLREIQSAHQLDDEGRSLLRNAVRRMAGCAKIAGGCEERAAQLRGWVAALPDSPLAKTVLGRFLINYAWDARGRGFADTVVGEGWKNFEERLREAEPLLESACALDPTDPIAPSLLVIVAMGLSEGREKAERQFRRAIQADAGYYDAYECLLDVLMPKWGGSRGAMFDFARTSAREAPPGSMIPRLISKAHWELYDSRTGVNYFREPGVWIELREVYEKLLQSFPRSAEMRNWFARTAYLAGDMRVLREQVEIIGENGLSGVWGAPPAYRSVREYVLALPVQP